MTLRRVGCLLFIATNLIRARAPERFFNPGTVLPLNTLPSRKRIRGDCRAADAFRGVLPGIISAFRKVNPDCPKLFDNGALGPRWQQTTAKTGMLESVRLR